MTEEPKNPALDGEEEEFLVVEMETEDGETEEFVVISTFKSGESSYAVMALYEDFERMDTMTDEEFNEYYGDEQSIFFVMRQEEEDAYIEVDEEEFKGIENDLQKHLEEIGE
ncbi:hypothetical protein [Acanthopleuribacter pedis]|uniref:DUF1292 domain-containing protein n=1 Tax=Acanthopleuribacter pedis TaxID=442870 RepID=A0A8J7QEN5_9BACT|nr:hypothetical protein [Acanthopleuribacter pedis]MBO1318350.1 hypothetical protein [Acanthopleuribacter pedis]